MEWLRRAWEAPAHRGEFLARQNRVCQSGAMRSRPAKTLFLAAGETIRFTTAGLARFAARFARVGIDIRRIKTRDQARAALTACQSGEWEAAIAQVAAKKAANQRDALERSCLLAIARGDKEQADALSARIERLNAAARAGIDRPEEGALDQGTVEVPRQEG